VIKRIKYRFRDWARRRLPVWGDGLARLYLRTLRWETVDYDRVQPHIESGRPFFCVTWHFDLLSVLWFFRNKVKGAAMVSRSGDGDAIAAVVERWGYRTVRGSKFKGGRRAAEELIELIHAGYTGGLVADGSQGPARRAQSGAVWISRASGAPLIPIIIVPRRRWVLKTWDRTHIPWPFTRMRVYIGPAIEVPPKPAGRNIEPYRRRLEESLNELCERGERDFGRFN
jgi:lysophospholipid acyltransferase (LPLAT)-like uncharacterized protein